MKETTALTELIFKYKLVMRLRKTTRILDKGFFNVLNLIEITLSRIRTVTNFVWQVNNHVNYIKKENIFNPF